METLKKDQVQNGKQIFAFKNVLNFREACEYSGFSHSHMYKLTSAKKIGHFCPNGKMIFFNPEELEAWLQQGRRSTKNEVVEKVNAFSL